MVVNNLEAYRDVLSVIYYLATIIGIPVSICVYLWEKRKERTAREMEIYVQTYDRYISYLQQTLEHKELRCGEFTGDEPSLKKSGFSVEQITLYTILTLTLEQAFYLYHKLNLCKKDDFGNTWLDYIAWWTTRPDFQKAWGTIDGWYEAGFKAFVNEKIAEAQATQTKKQGGEVEKEIYSFRNRVKKAVEAFRQKK